MDSKQQETEAAVEPGAMERLRDRTDELELIISSLTIFALFSLPGWLLDKIADVFTHFSTSFAIASTVGSALLAGVCYGLAACFIVHLMARAYWVGLIGLRTVFPGGVNWRRTPSLGPLTRQYYKDTLPDLDTMIRSTDRLASSLFAVISMLTLSVLWCGVILMAVLVVSGAIGSRFGYTNAAIAVGSLLLLLLLVGAPIVLYVLDAQLASRVPALRESRAFVGIVRFLRRIAGLAYPQRLVLPVQLTLQSNTRPLVFFVALLLAVLAIVLLGNVRAAAWSNFTLSGEFTYLDSTRVADGFRSTYYEDMSSPFDRLRAWPRIDSFEQGGSFVRLFLPYQPLRDNLVLDQFCGAAGEASDPVDCLRQLWAVSIDGQPVSTAGFEVAERADLKMRGLIGLVPLSGLEPGMHRIEVTWNPDDTGSTVPLDDRYTELNSRYVIPISFSPGFERPLESQ